MLRSTLDENSHEVIIKVLNSDSGVLADRRERYLIGDVADLLGHQLMDRDLGGLEESKKSDLRVVTYWLEEGLVVHLDASVAVVDDGVSD